MDPGIIGGIIGAGGSVAGALIAVYASRKRKSAESHIDKVEVALNSTGNKLADVSPYTISKLSKYVEFDEAGVGEQIQKWHGIKAKQRFENLQIPFSYTVDIDGSDLMDHECEALERSPLTVKLVCDTLSNEKNGVKCLKGKFHLLGYFDPDTDPVSFYWKQRFTGAYHMSREAAMDAYKDSDWKTEYTASALIVPTDLLEIEVRFPSSFKEKIIKPSPVAFIGGTHIVNRLETTRIKEFYKYSNGVASLNVSEPIVGMNYAITWMPPLKG